VSSLTGRPVVCLTLHSQLAPVCAALGPTLAIAYVQLAGGALPLRLSDTVQVLERRFTFTTVSVGPCFGGTYEAVNVASALVALAAQAEVVVCGIGPGIVGTGS